MPPVIPLSVSVPVPAASVVICALVLFGLFQGLAAADLPPLRKIRFGLIAAVGLIGWLFLAGELARAGVFEPRLARTVPAIGPAIGLPIVIGLLALRFSATLRAVLDAIPMQWLVGVQLYRAVGLVFLIALGAGLVPGVFAWPAGLGDIAVGLLAPLVAWRVVKGWAGAAGATGAAGLVLAWCLLGIGDLVLAVGLGFFSSPGRWQMLAFDSTNLMSSYPLVMVPLFAVPVSILLHAAVLWKLGAARRRGRVDAVAAA